MLKLMRYIKPHALKILAALLLIFIQANCSLLLPNYMSRIVDQGIAKGNMQIVWSSGGAMLLVSLASALCSVCVALIASRVAASVCQKLRYDVFCKVQSFSHAQFDEFTTASLITRTTNDITQVQNLIVMLIRIAFLAPIMGIGGMIYAIQKSPSMSWIIILAVVLILCLIACVFSLALPRFRKIQKLIDKLNTVVRENLSGILVIRAFGTQKFEEKRFEKANDDLTKTNLFVSRLMSCLMPTMTLIMNLTTVLIAVIGSNYIAQGDLAIGDMMAYIQYVMQIIISFLILSMMFIMIPRASVSAERIAAVLNSEQTIINNDNAPKKSTSTGLLHFENVSFRYPNADEDVLHNITFTAKPGQTTAFIGSTGSGKTSIINLVLRFYDVTSGTITLDGTNIKDIDIHDLRDKLGYVPQKSVLFSGTIKSNLTYADKNASSLQIKTASDTAMATEFINSKEDGIDSHIAQAGSNISGGQKQRLSIARAILKKPKIYIFDDSFSALDFKTDAALRRELKNQTQNTTVLLVAQRISTIRDAENIIVMDNGKIAGQGTHSTLMNTCDVYREIALSQLSEEELS